MAVGEWASSRTRTPTAPAPSSESGPAYSIAVFLNLSLVCSIAALPEPVLVCPVTVLLESVPVCSIAVSPDSVLVCSVAVLLESVPRVFFCVFFLNFYCSST